jgi:hypothetical protein
VAGQFAQFPPTPRGAIADALLFGIVFKFHAPSISQITTIVNW